MQLTRRTFLAGLGGAGLTWGGGFGYMRWGEPRWFEATTTVCATGRSDPSQPVRLLHLSDLHASRFVPLSMIAEAVQRGLATEPDMIVLTGDFWTDKFSQLNAYAEVLRPLVAAAPTYAVPGNHDGGSWARAAGGYLTFEPLEHMLAAAGIVLLRNLPAFHQVGPRQVTLLGVGDWWSGDCAPYRTFTAAGERAAGELRIVLSHNPDAKTEFADYDWDLMCCGHTHGGQLRMPLTGQTPFAPIQDHRYVAGLNPWQGRQIFTTRGVGNLHGLRFNCRPEISLLLVS